MRPERLKTHFILIIIFVLLAAIWGVYAYFLRPPQGLPPTGTRQEESLRRASTHSER